MDITTVSHLNNFQMFHCILFTNICRSINCCPELGHQPRAWFHNTTQTETIIKSKEQSLNLLIHPTQPKTTNHPSCEILVQRKMKISSSRFNHVPYFIVTSFHSKYNFFYWVGYIVVCFSRFKFYI